MKKAAEAAFFFLHYRTVPSEMTVLAVPVAQHEGLAVGTLNDSRILLVSTYLYLFKCAVTLAGVVGTLMNRTGDAVICLFFHNFSIASRNHFFGCPSAMPMQKRATDYMRIKRPYGKLLPFSGEPNTMRRILSYSFIIMLRDLRRIHGRLCKLHIFCGKN